MVATLVGKFIYVVWDQSMGFFVDRFEPSSSAEILAFEPRTSWSLCCSYQLQIVQLDWRYVCHMIPNNYANLLCIQDWDKS